MRYFIQLSYNGSSFHGWQRQPNAVTVQQTIEEALSTILKNTTTITGAGRTDTGVHAQMMWAHMDIADNAFLPLPVYLPLGNQAGAKADINNLTYKLNSFLPKSIAIQQIVPVSDEAHTRFDATSRSYRYRISTKKDPFGEGFSYYFKKPLDLVAMNEAAKILFEYKDFECFSRTHTDVRTYLCDIQEAFWKVEGSELHFVITADRFLRNMVRAIVGSLLEIGIGKKDIDWLHKVIQSKDRSMAGASAPAHGLYLTHIEYPKRIFK